MVKECTKCQSSSNGFYGNMSICKKCDSERLKIYRAQNKNSVAVQRKEYRSINKELLIKQKSAYYERCKDKIKEKNKIYKKNRMQYDYVFKLRNSISRSIHKALLNEKNNESCLKYLPYTIEELRAHLESLFEPWMTWDNWGQYKRNTWDDNDSKTWTWNIDHIIPQADIIYQSMEDENFIKCWALENLRPFSAKANLIKGKRAKIQ